MMKTPNKPSESDRVRQLLEILFARNQSMMAEEIGIAQPVISRVVNGKHQPGKRLLAALAAHPKVNPAWLATGQGEPLLAVADTASSAGWPVPISSCLLPGPPKDHQNQLTPNIHYVPGVTYRETLYAIEARTAGTSLPEDLLALLRIFPDDLLLIETGQATWRENLGILHRRIGVLRLQAGNSLRIVLTSIRVGNQKNPNAIFADSTDELRDRLIQEEEDRKVYKERRKHLPVIQLREDATDQRKSKESKATENRVQLDEIVGLVVQLIRVFPRHNTEES